MTKQRPAKTLARIVTERLCLAALLVICVQVGLTVHRGLTEDTAFEREYVMLETQALASRATWRGDNLELTPPDYYSRRYARAYAYRISDERGVVLAAHNSAHVDRIDNGDEIDASTDNFWTSEILAVPHSAAGGASRRIGSRMVEIEVATIGDPAGRRYVALWSQIWREAIAPIAPAILLCIGLAFLTLQRAMAPIVGAARAADFVRPGAPARIETEGLPREVESLAASTNRLLDHVDAHVAEQKRIVAGAAHELRTPLAIMFMELEKLPAESARRLQDDVHEMASAVDRLIARLKHELTTRIASENVDLDAIAGRVVQQMAPLAARHGRALDLSGRCETPFAGDAVAAHEALRNLVENAIVHAEGGAHVRITLGPGREAIVEDDGPGISEDDAERLYEPFTRGATRADGAGLGLSIVREAMESQGGHVDITRSDLGGARFHLRFA